MVLQINVREDSANEAQLSKVHVTLIAFESLKPFDGVDAFVSARRKTPAEIIREASAAYKPDSANAPNRSTHLAFVFYREPAGAD